MAKVRHPNKKGLGRAKGVGTGKSLSELLILASTNPQHDKRLFEGIPIVIYPSYRSFIIDLQVQYMKITSL